MVEASPFVFEFDHIMCSMYDHVDKAHNVTDLAIMMNANDRAKFVSYQENGRSKNSKYVHVGMHIRLMEMIVANRVEVVAIDI